MTRINNAIVALVLAILTISSHAQSEAPRLVVTITVDQLRTDLMQAFMPLYGEGGFRRLMSEGCMFTHAQYPFVRPDRASAIASLYSGCSPYDNGIVGSKWMDRSTLRPANSIDDSNCRGINTTTCASPTLLSVSTLTDELKVNSEGRAIIYSIAPDADAAIYSAGHAANGAVWIDDSTGQWCTSSYYYGMPSWAQAITTSLPLSERVKAPWQPMNELVGNFNYFTSGGMRNPFSHKLTGDTRYRDFKTTGLVNDEVNRLAIACLQSSGMGLDATPDILCLTYYAGNYLHRSAAASPMEIQDTYVRLDNALAHIIDQCERLAGRDRVLFILTSTGYCDEDQPAWDRYRIPSGTFSMRRAASLLGMYLGAVYGNAQWVTTQYRRQIYLDHKLIEDRGINISEMLERCTDFLVQMSGVQDVYTTTRLQLAASAPGTQALRASINPKRSGDIILDIAPGWRIDDEDHDETTFERKTYTPFPLILMGTAVPHAIHTTPILIDRLAPTVSQLLRIPAPNACSQPPLTLTHTIQ